MHAYAVPGFLHPSFDLRTETQPKQVKSLCKLVNSVHQPKVICINNKCCFFIKAYSTQLMDCYNTSLSLVMAQLNYILERVAVLAAGWIATNSY